MDATCGHRQAVPRIGIEAGDANPGAIVGLGIVEHDLRLAKHGAADQAAQFDDVRSGVSSHRQGGVRDRGDQDRRQPAAGVGSALLVLPLHFTDDDGCGVGPLSPFFGRGPPWASIALILVGEPRTLAFKPFKALSKSSARRIATHVGEALGQTQRAHSQAREAGQGGPAGEGEGRIARLDAGPNFNRFGGVFGESVAAQERGEVAEHRASAVIKKRDARHSGRHQHARRCPEVVAAAAVFERPAGSERTAPPSVALVRLCPVEAARRRRDAGIDHHACA